MADPITDFLTANSSSISAGGVGLSALGTLLQGQGYQEHGVMTNEAAQFAARQLRMNANDAMAMGQRQAYDIVTQGQYISSKALAMAAGSGGGASDPTIMAIQARTAGEVAYRSAAAIYGGQSRARNLNLNADAEEWSGKEAELQGNKAGSAGQLASVATLLKGGVSLFEKYRGNNYPGAGIGQVGDTNANGDYNG